MTSKSILLIIWKITFLVLIDTVCAQYTNRIDEKGFDMTAYCNSGGRPPFIDMTNRISTPVNVFPELNLNPACQQEVSSEESKRLTFKTECFETNKKIYSFFIEKTDLNPFYINRVETPLLYKYEVNCEKVSPVASFSEFRSERLGNRHTTAPIVDDNRQRSNQLNKYGFRVSALCPSSRLPMEVDIQSRESSVDMYTMPNSFQVCRMTVPMDRSSSYKWQYPSDSCFLPNEQIYSIFIEQHDSENPFYTNRRDKALLYLYTLDCRSANPVATLKVADLERIDVEPPSYIYAGISGRRISMKVSEFRINGGPHTLGYLAPLGSELQLDLIHDGDVVHPKLGAQFYAKNCNVTEDSFPSNSLAILKDYCPTRIAHSIKFESSYYSDTENRKFYGTLRFITFALKSLNEYTISCEVCSDAESCRDYKSRGLCPRFDD